MPTQFASNVLVQAVVSPLPVVQGGTGKTTAPTAINALLPPQSGYSGRVLATDGTTAYWGMPPVSSAVVGTSGYSGIAGVAGISGNGASSLVFNINAYGAEANNPASAANNVVAFNNAISAASAAGGGIVFVPQGTYYVNSTISWSANYVSMQGVGPRASCIVGSGNYGNILQVGNGSTNPAMINITSLGITNLDATPRTTGACIYVTNAHGIMINDVLIGYGGCYTGVQFEGGAQQFDYRLSNFEISDCVNGIVLGKVSSTSLNLQDVFINTGIIGGTASTSAGIIAYHVSGLYVTNIDILNNANSFVTYPGANQTCVYAFLTNVLCDTAVQSGLVLLTGPGGLVANWNISNCWTSSAGSYGTHIAGNVKLIAITGLMAINNKKHGILIQTANNISLSNCTVGNNSQSVPNVFSGLAVDGSVANDISVLGGSYGIGWHYGTNVQQYGILITSGAALTRYSIIGANLAGNMTLGLIDGVLHESRKIYGNLGFVTSTRGSATVANGTDYITVNHGLTSPPQASEILVTPTSNLVSGSVSCFWVSSITSTTFRINTNGVVFGLPVSFAWQVRTAGA